MSSPQILKGLLEACILKLIETEETYGYKVCEDLSTSGFQKVSEGTIYPILIRLEKRGYISSTKKESPLGPQRKYFNITESGKQYLLTFTKDWNSIQNTVNFFIK